MLRCQITNLHSFVVTGPGRQIWQRCLGEHAELAANQAAVSRLTKADGVVHHVKQIAHPVTAEPHAGELARWGIETVIVAPGVYTSGSNHFAHADMPGDEARAAEYASGPTSELAEQAKQADLASVPVDADAADVARAIVRMVAMPFGTRPLRITIDPADGGTEELNKIADRVRAALS